VGAKQRRTSSMSPFSIAASKVLTTLKSVVFGSLLSIYVSLIS
jgi:hypothetical protein